MGDRKLRVVARIFCVTRIISYNVAHQGWSSACDHPKSAITRSLQHYEKSRTSHGKCVRPPRVCDIIKNNAHQAENACNHP